MPGVRPQLNPDCSGAARRRIGRPCLLLVSRGRYSEGMARPPKDNDATGNLKPDDKTQVLPKGTKIGLLRRADVLRDFRKIAKHNK